MKELYNAWTKPSGYSMSAYRVHGLNQLLPPHKEEVGTLWIKPDSIYFTNRDGDVLMSTPLQEVKISRSLLFSTIYINDGKTKLAYAPSYFAPGGGGASLASFRFMKYVKGYKTPLN